MKTRITFNWKRLDNLLAIALSLTVLLIAVAYWAAVLQAFGAPPFWKLSACDYGGCHGFFPWPWTGGECVFVLMPMDPVDRFFCLLMTTYLFVPLVVGETLSSGLVGKQIGKMILTKRNEL